ncbi:unnamed protein product [Mytilus coruscus]|uniref:Uncharacterized protein n=1 Tax=Mytilus coruscus TaxID=42192 RepID=A0A6J8ANM2_MYTCO|nr:unnamed protein product [Mytilus coruscus]
MALVLNRDSVNDKDSSSNVIVPNNPTAKLMYYLNCMCKVLNLDQTEYDITRLTDFRRYVCISDEDLASMIILCSYLDPGTLTDVCIFQDEVACGNNVNKFCDVNTRLKTIAAAQSVMVGNVKVKVKKIMFYKMTWIETYYVEPLAHFIALYDRPSRRQQSQQSIQLTDNVQKPQPPFRRYLYDNQQHQVHESQTIPWPIKSDNTKSMKVRQHHGQESQTTPSPRKSDNTKANKVRQHQVQESQTTQWSIKSDNTKSKKVRQHHGQ